MKYVQMYKDLTFKTSILKNRKDLQKINEIISNAKILSLVQMYDTNFEIIYNFWTGLHNINFNKAFSILDILFL